ncbi:hypothetical protein EON65_46110 [archaeon]|nr:MAG: hypothetical protein EON65_46110 [archaeon]
MSRNIWLDLLGTRGYEAVWSCLSLKDVAALTITSLAGEDVLISEKSCSEIISRYQIGHWRLSSFQAMKATTLLRVVRMLRTPQDVQLILDDRNGRILIDVGSIKESSGGDTDTTEMLHEDPESMTIFKHLEKCSYDEYDDFQPRHPLPKDRGGAHRRGDSYFNSDVDTVISELGNMASPSGDLRNMARSALLNVAETAATATPSSGNTAKNRILAKKNNMAPKSPGLPPPIPKRRPGASEMDD